MEGISEIIFATAFVELSKRNTTQVLGCIQEIAVQWSENFQEFDEQQAFVKSAKMILRCILTVRNNHFEKRLIRESVEIRREVYRVFATDSSRSYGEKNNSPVLVPGRT